MPAEFEAHPPNLLAVVERQRRHRIRNFSLMGLA